MNRERKPKVEYNARPGIRNGNSKLTRSEVLKIYYDFVTPTSKLAAKHGVSQWAINRIQSNKTYKEIR